VLNVSIGHCQTVGVLHTKRCHFFDWWSTRTLLKKATLRWCLESAVSRDAALGRYFYLEGGSNKARTALLLIRVFLCVAAGKPLQTKICAVSSLVENGGNLWVQTLGRFRGSHSSSNIPSAAVMCWGRACKPICVILRFFQVINPLLAGHRFDRAGRSTRNFVTAARAEQPSELKRAESLFACFVNVIVEAWRVLHERGKPGTTAPLGPMPGPRRV